MALVQQIKVPLIAVNDTSLTVVNIPFSQGAFVKAGAVVLVFETSKTTYDVVAEADGFIEYRCAENEDYEVNEIVANVFSTLQEVPLANSADPAPQLLTTNTPEPEVNVSFTGTTVFSKAAMELMEQLNLTREVFAGKDFVSKKDVEQLPGIATKRQEPLPVASTVRPSGSLPIDAESVVVGKLSSGKKREIEYLSSVQSAGLISTINSVLETEGLFTHMNRSLRYLKNSLLPAVIYESARLLEKYSELNAYFTGDGIARYKAVNIGFAVDIDKGLKVLRIEQAGKKSMSSIETSIVELSGKYLDDTLQIEDLTDISFTITDLSAEGVAFFTPLVNRMNSAILGISSIDAKLNRCTLSVTFDHRVTEGKLVARFLHELTGRLQSYRGKDEHSSVSHVQCFKCLKTLKEDLGDVGFSRCVTPAGADAYICQSCFKGF